MSRFFLTVILALVAFAGATALARACDEYKNLDISEIKELRDKLSEAGADPLDRLYSFQELSCSNNPAIRSYAVREGMKSAGDPLVREQIMFESLMQKTRLDIELISGPDVNDADRSFIRSLAGVWSELIEFRSRADGCLSISSSRDCRADYSAFIRGSAFEVNAGKFFGEFELSETGELIGFVRTGQRGGGRIPARIDLN